jgi:putative transposase
LNAADLREIFDTILPEQALKSAVESVGFQERERKLDAVRLLRAMVIAASTGYGGRQADVMRQYFELGGEHVVRGGFYSWFGPELEKVMEVVRDRALDYVAQQPCDLPGWLGCVRDWIIVDSSTVKLDDRLKEEYPGAGDYAAVKLHKHFSVGVGTTLRYHLSPAREHDSPHLVIDESWAGLGLLADLGYASLQLLGNCQKHDVKYVIRLKESWKPKVDTIRRGMVTRTFAKGSDLDLLLEQEVLMLNDRAIDARVRIGSGSSEQACRMVAVPTPKGYCFYLTNLPGKIGPHQVADLYRVRWEIESDNKLDKSCLNLDKIGARTGPAVRALIHASITGSTIVGLMAHHHRRRETLPKKAGAERITPPIHPQSLARAVGCAAQSIASAMELKGDEAQKRWQELADYLEHLGKDPNWRSRPSILDQLRGWRVSPGRKKVVVN